MTTLPRLIALLLLVAFAAPVDAEAKLAFFRNYPDLKWNVIKTEHFNVFYPESKNPGSDHYVDADFTARKTAYVAEEMYPLICGQFNYYLDETINIVMLDQTDDLTGYTVPNFDWIVVSGRHSDLLWRLRGHHDWLRAVMYHEFAHVVSLKADNVFAEESFGVALTARWSDGRVNTQAEASTFLMKGDPWWWVEGGGEYYPHVAGINTWTASRDMRMRMDVLEDTALNFDDMGDYFGSNGGFDGNRHYLGGYAFALYLEERFGQGVYQSFGMEREKKGWTPMFKTVIEDVLNIPANDLYADWRKWMLEKYGKVRDEVMTDPAIGEPLRLSLPYWYSDDPADRESVEYKQTFKGADRYKYRRDREADGIYAWGVKFAPDGSRWGRHRLGRGAEINLVGEDELPVFGKGWDDPHDQAAAYWRKTFDKHINLELEGDGTFDWSPDSSKVVTVCPEDRVKTKAGSKHSMWTESRVNLDGYSWHTLCVADLAEIEELGRQAMLDHFGFDPMEEDAECYEKKLRGIEDCELEKTGKAKKDKWRHWADWIQNDIVIPYTEVEDAEGTPIQRVSYPAWSPDGKTIAFVKYDDGTQNIWTVDIESKAVTELTRWTDGTRVEGLDWSPDGKQLVFDAWRFDQNDIYVINADGTGAEAITFDKFEDREPTWGHDGNIYFVSDRVGHRQNVFRVNPRLEAGRKDADLDGLLDDEDECPDEPETVNLYKDADGCPDGIPVRVTKEAIVITDKVFFELDSDVIKPESFELLDALARVVLENPQIVLTEVGGHSDSQGEPDYNLDLSERRAAAVRTYLVGKGVQVDRLTSKGYGMTEPLVEGDTEEAYSTNRRVEFKILEQVPVDEVREVAGSTDEGGVAADAEDSYICGQGEEEQRLRNAYMVQVTNVVSGAFFPELTPKGHLAYSHYTPWGWKDQGLHCKDFHNQVVDDSVLVIDQGAVGFDKPSELYPDYSVVTSLVKSHAAFPRNPVIIPIIEIANVSLTHMGVNVGAFVSGSDSLDTNQASVFLQAGENLMIQGRYQNNAGFAQWWVGGLIRAVRFDYAFNSDDDGSSATTDDQFLGDIKQGFLVAGGFAGVDFPFSNAINLGISTFQIYTGIQGVADGKRYRPLQYRSNQAVELNIFSPRIAFARRGGAGSINVSGGRAFTFRWSPNVTFSLNPATGGIQIDDGQKFKNYFYNQYYVSYAEYIALPFKNKKTGGNLGHTLQVQADVGLIDRNVPFSDEMRGGGAGANRNFANPVASNVLFAGYEPFSLSGETSALLNLQYRFPIARQIDKKIGPIYFESIYAGFFGTVGNFWSYRVKDGEPTNDFFGEPVVLDEQAQWGGGISTNKTVIREWPGMLAAENGNAVLADAGAELRIAANLWNRSAWLTSFRVAYGFNSVGGRGDINNDGIFTNSSDPSIARRADEREPAGIRFYIGIGTGW